MKSDLRESKIKIMKSEKEVDRVMRYFVPFCVMDEGSSDSIHLNGYRTLVTYQNILSSTDLATSGEKCLPIFGFVLVIEHSTSQCSRSAAITKRNVYKLVENSPSKGLNKNYDDNLFTNK